MDTAEIFVTAGGAALAAFILWFFFGPKTATRAPAAGGRQQIDIEVRGAYNPDRIEVEQGKPVTLTFTRKEANACTAQVVFPDFGIVKDLPVGRPVTVEVTPERPGEHEFHCGMNMVRGRLVVRPNVAGVPAQGRFGAQGGSETVTSKP
jgi:plastocyanin domain-containing protein